MLPERWDGMVGNAHEGRQISWSTSPGSAVRAAALLLAMLPAWAGADIVLGTVLKEPLPCGSGEEFTVRIFLDTERDDLRSVNSLFTYNSNRFEYRSTTEAPGFEGTVQGTGVEFLNLGTYSFSISRVDEDEFLPSMFLADVTFRTKESNLSGRSFTNEPPTDPLFVREGGSTFTRPFDLSRTEQVTCGQGGLVNAGTVSVRSELVQTPACGEEGTARVRLHLDTDMPFVHEAFLTARYDAARFRLTGSSFLEEYGPVDGSVAPPNPFDPGEEVQIQFRRPAGQGSLGQGPFLELEFEARGTLGEDDPFDLFTASEDAVLYRFQGMDPMQGAGDFSATEGISCRQEAEPPPAAWIFY